MNKCLLLLLAAVSIAYADTPPPGTVKSKTFSGDGNTSIGATGSSLNVNVTNASGLTTVNQGTGGVSAWKVDGSAVTQPVSGTFWPVTQPVSGTFWQATQPVSGSLGRSWTLLSSTDSVNVGNFPSSFNIGNFPTSFQVSNFPASQAVTGTFWQATQPVSGPLTDTQLRATPVPISGTITASNSANGATGATAPAQATQIGGSDGSNLRAVKVDSAGVVSVDGSGVTQPISAASLPLPSGAATAAGLTTINSTLGTPMQQTGGTVTANAGTGTFAVSAASLPLPSGAATSAKQPALGTAGTPSSDVITVQGVTSMTALKVDGSAVTQPVSAAALPLPSGAATSANQTTANSSLATIATNTTNAGTPTVSGTVTSNQGTGGVSAWKVDGSAVTQPVSGTVTANAGSGTMTVGQATGTNLHVVVDTAPTTAVTQSGSWNVTSTSAVPTAVTVKQAAVTIGTSAVRLTTDGSAPSSTRRLLVAQLLSTSTANCYFGSSGVTSSSTGRGVQMFAGQSFSFSNDAGDYYAICDTSAQTFFITEQE